MPVDGSRGLRRGRWRSVDVYVCAEIQNFANWFTYYRSREYMAKAALGRTVSEVSNIRLAYVTLNDANERTKMSSMNASYRIGNKKAMLNQIYKIDSNSGTPLRVALDKAGKYFECRAGDSFGSTGDTTPGNAACPVLPSPQGSVRTTSRCFLGWSLERNVQYR
jgi:type IV pilus assembly protein PilY1